MLLVAACGETVYKGTMRGQTGSRMAYCFRVIMHVILLHLREYLRDLTTRTLVGLSASRPSTGETVDICLTLSQVWNRSVLCLLHLTKCCFSLMMTHGILKGIFRTAQPIFFLPSA